MNVVRTQARSQESRLLNRIAFVALVAAYYAIYSVSYERFLQPAQGYFGFGLRELPPEHVLLCWFVVLAPATWMPRRVDRPSQLLFLLQYLVLYVPATVVVYHADLPRLAHREAAALVIAMFVGLSLWQASYRLPPLRIDRARLSPGLFWSLFALAGLGCVAVVVAFLGSNFRIANLVDIYDVRFSAAERLASGGGWLAAYAQGWLAGVFLPVALAAGLLLHRRLLVVATVGGYVFLFGVGGAKTSLIAAPLLAALGWWASGRSGPTTAKLIVALTLALVFPAVFALFRPFGDFLETWYVALVHSRIFGIPQLLMAQYLEYFNQHSYTLWSHVRGLDALLGYPYDLDIPRVLGGYYYGPNVGSNAGMWAQDGIAAIGLAGIPVISVVAAAVAWLLDSVAVGHRVSFVIVSLGFIAISFTNTSLATTLLTGGLSLLTLALWFMPPLSAAEPRVGNWAAA